MSYKPKKAKNFKKAFVVTTTKFDPFLNTSSDWFTTQFFIGLFSEAKNLELILFVVLNW